MLVALLVLSVAFTMACVVAEASPPKPLKQEKKSTPVMVEMQEDNDFDGDPPTVVGTPRHEVPDITRTHRIEFDMWTMVSPPLRMGLLKVSQFFAWLATL